MTENLTREDLLVMVANQMQTIYQLHSAIGEALQAIDSEMPDLAWRRLLQARERFRNEEDLSDCYETIKGQR